MKQFYLILLLFISSCAVGPNFTSPTLDLPETIGSDSLPNELQPIQPDAKWWNKFGDLYLDTLIEKALLANRDIKIAKKRVEMAQLSYGNSKAALAPTFGINASAKAEYNNVNKIVQSYGVTPTMNWELDIFGGGRRAKEASYATSVAASYEYNGVLLSVISNVAQSYFTLLEYNASQEIAKKSFLTRKKSYELMEKMFSYGSISRVSLNQSYTLMLDASIAVDRYKNSITEVSTGLSQLLGENPHSFNIPKDAILKIKTPSLPSQIMPAWIVDNRPDIMSSYYDVWASSAKVGVAVSQRFPTIGLNADGGILYDIIKGTTTSMPFVWNGAFTIAETLLNFGTNKRNVKIAKLDNQIEIINFENNVVVAFGEVENAISQILSYSRQETDYNKLVNTNISINMMTNQLYRRGLIDYLDVLDADRALFQAQIQQTSTISNKLTSYISLYKAIGGGW